ncbi:MAG: AEC family transporter [Candidatus Brocadiia bacterium]
MTVKLLTFLFDLLLPLIVGYVLVWKWNFTGKSFDRVITFTIVGVVPFLVLLSFWNLDLDSRLLMLPILGLMMQFIPGAIGWLRSQFKQQDSLEKGSYVLSCLICNRGVLGGLAVYILFGEEAYAYSQLVGVFGLPVLVMVAFPLASYYHRSHHDISEGGRSILDILLDRRQLPLVGLMVGAALNVSGLERPEVCGMIFSVLIHVVAWALLVPVGASLDFSEIKHHWRGVLDIIPNRFLICPLLLYIVGTALGFEGVLLYTVVILSATPTAINSVVTAKLYNLNVHLAAAAFVLTTTLFMTVIFPGLLVLFSYFPV